MNIIALKHLAKIFVCAFDTELLRGAGASAFKRIRDSEYSCVGKFLVTGNMYAARNATRADNADADCLRRLERVARVAFDAALPPLTALELEVFATDSIPLCCELRVAV
jgi:hypothetical protein